MNRLGKMIKYGGRALIILGVIIPLAFAAPSKTWADDDSSAGKSLYDALRAVYGSGSKSSSDSSDSSEGSDSGESKSNENKESTEITTDDLMQRMETEKTGPTVTEATLEEIYHEDYKVYEEKLGGSYTIFSNVKNGGVTKRPVLIDVPSGVGTSMKKDGSDVVFVSKKSIADEGTYVLDLFVADDTDEMEPFSRRNYLRAKLRFRIQYKKGVSGVIGEDYSEEDDSAVSQATEESTEENPLNIPEEFLQESTEEGTLPEDMMPDDFEFEETEPVEEEKPKEPVAAAISGKYDSETGYYKNTLLNGDSFYSSLPNGSLTNEAVLVQEAEGLKFTAYRNGVEYEDFKAGEYVNDTGSFAIYVSKPEDPAFEKAYSDGLPAFRFRIVNGAVADIGIVTAPEDTTIRSARYNGLEIPDSMMINDKMVHLDGDGDYEITFEDEAGSREVYFTLDTEQPWFSVATMPNEATITYYSKDVSRCRLYRGNELVSDGEIVYDIKEPGKYDLYVYDAAGNMTDVSFSVNYQLNTAAVIAIISVLLIAAGVTIYMIRIKKKIKVV